MRIYIAILACLLTACATPEPRPNAKCAAEAVSVADKKAHGFGPEWWRVFEGNAYNECVKAK